MSRITFSTKSNGLTSQQATSQNSKSAVANDLLKIHYDEGKLVYCNASSSAPIFTFDFKDKNDIKVMADLDNLPHIRVNPEKKAPKRKAEEPADAKKEPAKKKPKKVAIEEVPAFNDYAEAPAGTPLPKKPKKPKAKKVEAHLDAMGSIAPSPGGNGDRFELVLQGTASDPYSAFNL